MYRHLMVPLDDSPLVGRDGQPGRQARPRARREGDVLPRAGGLRRIEHRRARARDVAGGVQRARGRRGARDPRQGRSGRPRSGRAPRLRGHDERPAATRRSSSAAEARGCDLIFIASHGRRGIKGLMLGSRDAEGPAAHDDSGAGVGGREQSARRPSTLAPLAIIRDEHRSLPR